MSTDPSPQQIKAYCERLQSTWTPAEHAMRQNFQVVPSDRYGMTLRRGTNADIEEYTVPSISVRELEEAA